MRQPLSHVAPDDLGGLVAFLHDLGRLKALRRQGWIDRDVEAPESVADHSFRLALMSWIVAGRLGLRRERAMVLALVHDVPEARAGDLTPFGDLSDLDQVERRAALRRHPDRPAVEQAAWDAAKREREEAGLAELAVNLGRREQRAFSRLWREYENGRSPEARLVRHLDKLETWLQAREYAAAQPEISIESFAEQVERLDLPPELRAIASAITGAVLSAHSREPRSSPSDADEKRIPDEGGG